MYIVVGAVLTLVGAWLLIWGGYRFIRPRRAEDVEWIEANPVSNWMLGGGLFGFDRAGAMWSVVVGVLGVLMGVLVMLD